MDHPILDLDLHHLANHFTHHLDQPTHFVHYPLHPKNDLDVHYLANHFTHPLDPMGNLDLHHLAHFLILPLVVMVHYPVDHLHSKDALALRHLANHPVLDLLTTVDHQLLPLVTMAYPLLHHLASYFILLLALHAYPMGYLHIHPRTNLVRTLLARWIPLHVDHVHSKTPLLLRLHPNPEILDVVATPDLAIHLLANHPIHLLATNFDPLAIRLVVPSLRHDC